MLYVYTGKCNKVIVAAPMRMRTAIVLPVAGEAKDMVCGDCLCNKDEHFLFGTAIFSNKST